MTKEPADWAKIKAYRTCYPDGGPSDEGVVYHWDRFSKACHELARMYDKYEQPPVDPDLMAARDWCAKTWGKWSEQYIDGSFDGHVEIEGFLAGIKHGRANP